MDLGLGKGRAIVWDATICLPFFALHSGMIRPGIRRRLSVLIPERWHAAAYSILSGVFLLFALGLWQNSGEWAYRLPASGTWLFRATFLAAGLGFAWSVSALEEFDALGIGQAKHPGRGSITPTTVLTVSGPYRWVRHPLYFLSLVMIWACPAVTTDRLMFNLLWSLWIVIGVQFEERDLVMRFGGDYRRYQQCVPMLIPHRRPCPSRTPCRTCPKRQFS